MKSGTAPGTTPRAFLHCLRYWVGYQACRPRKTGTGTTGYHLGGQRGWWVPPYRGTTPARPRRVSHPLTNPKYLRYCDTVAQWTDEQKAEAVAMLEAGRSLIEVSAEYGPSTSSLSRWAEEAGLDLAGRSQAKTAEATRAHMAKADERRVHRIDRLNDLADEAIEREFALLDDADLRSVVGARTRAIHDAELLAGRATSRTESLSAIDDEIRELTEALSMNDPVDA